MSYEILINFNTQLDDLSVLDLDIRSRSHIKGNRREGVCAFSECFLILFYTSTKSWRGYIFTAVCVCVCVCLSVCLSVCPALLVNKMSAERMHRFRRGFR